MTLDHKKGILNEEIALSFLQKQGFALVSKNKKVNGVEIDLLLKKDQTLYLFEVKSDNLWRTERPMSSKQKDRLTQVALEISESEQCSVRLILAIVKKNKQVDLLPLDDFPFGDYIG